MRKYFVIAAMLLAACSQAAEAKLECEKGGCSGNLCVLKGSHMMSTCEWTPAYGCYQKFGECGPQANGQCGWNPTPELKKCLDEAKSNKPVVR